MVKDMETDLLRHIFVRALITGEIQVRFDGVGATVAEIIEGKCYQTLQKIRRILDDHTLSDENCFERIEEIVCEFERLGSDGGSRHDFG